MPVSRTWNNVIDAYEIVVSNPIEADQLDELSFPSCAAQWISTPADQLTRLGACEGTLGGQTMIAASDGRVTLTRIEPEDREFESPQCYVVFYTNPLISRRLDLSTPDWPQLTTRLNFSIPDSFVSFAEAWPGLCIGGLDVPGFLLPSSEWLHHDALSPYDDQGRPTISRQLLERLSSMLLFQIDYWAKAKLLDANGIVWEFDIQHAFLASTGREFSVWLEQELASRFVK